MAVYEKIIEVNNYVTKSNLPDSDYVINPYIGCIHGCKYCYACFMKRFTNHKEEWGTFIDIKKSSSPIPIKKLTNKKIFMSSVTDCYNPLEEKHLITRKILNELINIDCYLTISTKSSLILRDIDLIKQMKNVKVALSINTLDEKFRADMDQASNIKERLDALKILHDNGIYTVLFMSPIFPKITDFKEIIQCSNSFVNEYWFENLNLRGSYKHDIMNYIKREYSQYYALYEEIYIKKNNNFWENLSNEIEDYCMRLNLNYINYFYHEKLVKKNKQK